MTYECTFCGHEGHSEAFCPTAIAIRQAEALERIVLLLEKLPAIAQVLAAEALEAEQKAAIEKQGYWVSQAFRRGSLGA